MVPREDPKKFLLPGTLETLDEEAEDDVFSELLKTNVTSVNMGDLLLDKQHNGRGGLNIAMEVLAKVAQHMKGKHDAMLYAIAA